MMCFELFPRPTHDSVSHLGRLMVLAVIAMMAVVSATPAQAQKAGDVTLVRDGKAVAKLYTAEPLDVPELDRKTQRSMSPAELREHAKKAYIADAIKDFVKHIELMSGATIEVVTTDDASQVKASAIVVGSLAVKMGATPQHETIVEESYRILTRDGMVLVGGEGDAGFSHGLYTILYNLGFDWIMPGEEGMIVPKQKTVTISAMDEASKPDFEVRAPWYSGGPRIIQGDEYQQLQQWMQRHRQSPRIGGNRIHPLFMEGGHFWHSLIRANKKMLEENPEMRALVKQPDGTYVRGWAQLEPTHPKVIDLTVEWVKERYKEHGLEKTDTLALSIGPNDGGGYSISADAIAAGAQRVEPVSGGDDQTDVLILYTNKVLEKLKPEYPNVYLGWYIYSVHSDYPQRYTPDPNFVGNIADITYSRYHSTLDPRSFTRAYYKGVVEQWSKLVKEQGNPLWFYGYNWNLAENLMPYTKLKIWGQDLPWYHEKGIRGHNNEQDKAWSILGPHNYLMARLGWDMSLDWKDVLKEYTTKAFGKGAPHMEAYYLDLIDTQEKGGHEAGAYSGIPLIFDRDFIKRSRDKFKKAMAAADTPEHKRNVDYFSQSVTALEIFLDYRQAITSFDFPQAKKELDRMVAHFDEYLAKNSNLVSRYGRRYLNWLFFPYVEQAVKYSTGDYSIVYKIPDALPTIFDPNTAGSFMNFYEPAKPDEHLIKTQTWGSTWDAQGLWPMRQGAVWYRIWFDMKDSDKPADGQGVGLYLGAFEDMAHVWCNGQYVGNARGFIRPAAFDLTDFVKPGEKNMIALQIIRTNMLNEMNLGGLLYPSFVFKGPRLETVAPATQPMERILPGGSREAAPQ